MASTTQASASNLSPTTLFTTVTSTAPWPAFPTVPYSGQALLTGTCTLPQYTMLYFPNGGSLEVPLIGCSDQRPECCPGILSGSSETSATVDASPTSATATESGPPPTGVVSAMSQFPLSICPSDMVDLDPVCCPIGYKQYGQSIIGNLPCVSTVTSTVFTVPPAVLASVSSILASSLEAETSATSATSTAAPTVSFVQNLVFALGLPCGNDEKSSSSLSTAAKAGIGAGVGVAVLLALALAFILIYRYRKHKLEAKQVRNQVSVEPMAVDPKHMSAAPTMSSLPGSPYSNQAAYFQQQQQQAMPGYPQPGMYPMPGYVQPHGFPPTFGVMPTGHNSMQSHFMYPQHGVYQVGFMPQSLPGSPPPPFQASTEQKPVEVAGEQGASEPRSVSSGVLELSGSETAPDGLNSTRTGQRDSTGRGSST